MPLYTRPQRKRQFLLRGDAGLPAAGARPVSAGVPAGPLVSAPGGFAPEAERFALLAGVLDGVELGAWDRRGGGGVGGGGGRPPRGAAAGGRAGWDAATVLTVASWIERAREAGTAG